MYCFSSEHTNFAGPFERDEAFSGFFFILVYYSFGASSLSSLSGRNDTETNV